MELFMSPNERKILNVIILNVIFAIVTLSMIFCVFFILLAETSKEQFIEQDCIDKFGNGTYLITQETSIGIIPLGAKYSIYCVNNKTKEWLVLETNLR